MEIVHVEIPISNKLFQESNGNSQVLTFSWFLGVLLAPRVGVVMQKPISGTCTPRRTDCIHLTERLKQKPDDSPGIEIKLGRDQEHGQCIVWRTWVERPRNLTNMGEKT